MGIFRIDFVMGEWLGEQILLKPRIALLCANRRQTVGHWLRKGWESVG